MDPGEVPEDFPRDPITPVVTGRTPKVCVRLADGLYRSGQTDEERRIRWQVCEDLVMQLELAARRDVIAHPSRDRRATLERISAALRRKNWLSASELEWTIRRLQTTLEW
jgi:hypothetical protein